MHPTFRNLFKEEKVYRKNSQKESNNYATIKEKGDDVNITGEILRFF